MSTKDDDRGSTPSPQIQALRDQMIELREVVARIAAANAVENTIMTGFEILAAQLQPLRDLAPHREPLSDDATERLRSTQRALERPEWRGSNFEVAEVARRGIAALLEEKGRAR